ncbi:MAG: serpin family protein [Planctomycetota bacterium]
MKTSMIRFAPLSAALLLGLAPWAHAEDEPATTRVARANNRFGLEVAKRAHRPGENLGISPASLAMALHMAAEGADGETRAELVRVLGVEGLPLGECNRLLLGQLDDQRDVTLRLANSVWSSDRCGALLPGFAEVLTRDFKAHAAVLDFDDPQSVKTINAWVSERTEGMIPELLDRIPAEAAAYLINALYFQGSWTQAFDPKQTRPAAFTLQDGSKREVQLMHRSARARFLRDANADVVELPYGAQGGASMWLAVPRDDATLATLVEGLDLGTLARWSEKAHVMQGEVYLPRFKLSAKLELSSALRAVGIERALDAARADFTPVAERGEDLYISRVLHETVVEVDEQGTKAAAATAVELGVRGMPMTVRCDRPFLFVIQEHSTGSLLFVGAVYRP